MRHLPILLILTFAPFAQTMAQEARTGAAAAVKAAQERPDPGGDGYPRPTMMRPQWVSLDGEWHYAITAADHPLPTDWPGKLTVPAPFEMANPDGGGAPEPGQKLWYHRRFDRPTLEAGEIAVLRFDAVCSEATIWLNGTPITANRGGGVPFSSDITPFLSDEREQELAVGVMPPQTPEDGHPGGIGITQSVWLEVLPQTYIRELRLNPNAERGEITVFAGIWGQANFRPLEIVALDGERECAKAVAYYHYQNGGYETTMKIPDPKLWSPESPKLYGLRIRLANEDGTTHDDITSYFALRDTSLVDGPGGRPRFALNGEPLLLLGVEASNSELPRRDAEIRTHVEGTKAMGFNCVRISGGMASSRYYHWADRLGLLIWQSLPDPPPTPASDPVPSQAPRPFLEELTAIRLHSLNHPSIVVWPGFVPRVEGLERRPLTAARAGIDCPADLRFVHAQPRAAMPCPDSEAGSALAVVGISPQQPGQFDRAEFEASHRALQRLVRAGLSGATFSNHPSPTLDPAWVAGEFSKLNTLPTAGRPQALLPTRGEWLYSTSRPAEGWQLAAFDDSGWDRGRAPFGSLDRDAGTAWASDRLWLRRSFVLESPAVQDLFLKINNSDRVAVYLNGTLVARCTGASSADRLEPLPAEAATLLKDGENTIAIAVEGEGQDHFLDAGLTEFRP